MTELRVVPDPLAFPEGTPWRPWLASYSRSMQDVNDALGILQRQLRAGMISIDEARMMMGVL